MDEGERYRSLFQRSLDCVYIHDLEGNFIDANPAALELVGYAREEIPAVNLSTLLAPEELARAFEVIEEVRQKGFQESLSEFRLKRKNGSAVYVETKASLLYRDEKPCAVLGIARDVTERKKAEMALRESEERYRNLVDHSLQGLMIIQGWPPRIAFANKTAAGITGYSVKELLCLTAEKIGEMIHPEDREIAFGRVRDRLAGKEIPPRTEYRILRKNGSMRWIELFSQRIDHNGRPAVQVAIIDNTERREAEDDLLQSNEKFRQLFEMESDAIFLIDNENCRILEANSAGSAMYGYDRDDLLRMTIVDLSQEPEKTRQAIQGQHAHIQIRYHRRKDGSSFPVEIRSRYFRWKDREVHVAAIRDITERVRAETLQKQMEDHLKQAQKLEAIGTLAGGIAHDFNNILAAVIGFTELAQMEVPGGNGAGDLLAEALKAACRGRDLVRQILAFSRHGERQRLPVELGPIVKEASKFLRALIPSTIELREFIQDERATVRADPTQVHQILINLCTNAAHAMKGSGGILEVGLARVSLDEAAAGLNPDLRPGSFMKLMVRDTGHGMPPEILDKIFDPYFTTKDKATGTGLGLAVVHGIVKSHGGAVTVVSELGKGTTFHVFLPLAEETRAHPVSLPAGCLRNGKERILFVDDEPSLSQIGKQVLERLGYRVTAMMDSLEALEGFRKNPDAFDLVITDMTMPKMTGDRLAKALLTIRPDIPVVLCTGYSDLVSEVQAREMGIRAFLLKPVPAARLSETVRSVLDPV